MPIFTSATNLPDKRVNSNNNLNLLKDHVNRNSSCITADLTIFFQNQPWPWPELYSDRAETANTQIPEYPPSLLTKTNRKSAEAMATSQESEPTSKLAYQVTPAVISFPNDNKPYVLFTCNIFHRHQFSSRDSKWNYHNTASI